MSGLTASGPGNDRPHGRRHHSRHRASAGALAIFAVAHAAPRRVGRQGRTPGACAAGAAAQSGGALVQYGTTRQRRMTLFASTAAEGGVLILLPCSASVPASAAKRGCSFLASCGSLLNGLLLIFWRDVACGHVGRVVLGVVVRRMAVFLPGRSPAQTDREMHVGLAWFAGSCRL